MAVTKKQTAGVDEEVGSMANIAGQLVCHTRP